MSLEGNNNQAKHLDTAIENRDAVISLAERASFSINLFSPDLDPRVFDNSEFEQCIFELARKHRNPDIRILTSDSSRAVQQGHCLIRIAQKLTSSVFIHNPAREHKNVIATFMIVDGMHILHRPRSTSTNYDANVSFMSPQLGGELEDLFNEIWERSTPDSQIRRLYI